MTLSEKILDLRKQQGMSQENLAEKLGVSRQAVSRWEVGSALPDASNIRQLSRLFGPVLLLMEIGVAERLHGRRKVDGALVVFPLQAQRRHMLPAVKYLYSGIGDMVSKITALYDWAYEDRGGYTRSPAPGTPAPRCRILSANP